MTNSQRASVCQYKKDHPNAPLKELKEWLLNEHKIDVSLGTLSNTLKRSAQLLQSSDASRKDEKRHKPAKHPDVEEALFKWFTTYEDKVDMSGTLIQEEAARTLKKMHPDAPPFLFSEGWLSRFKTRYGISSFKQHGESGSVDMEQLEKALPEIREKLSQYEWRDIYNMDETGLFYRMQADRSLATKQLEGKKKDKERITIAVCSNGDGTDKLPLLVIGKSENPRCFKNIHRANLGCQYKWNKKAWMLETIFREWLIWFDKRINRPVLLLLDNCPAHGVKSKLPTLQNTEIMFLPPNTTSKLQPMDAGIIRSFKATIDYIMHDMYSTISKKELNSHQK